MKIISGTDSMYVSQKIYNVTDTDTSKAVVLYVPDSSDNTIAGTKIMKQLVTFTGILGQATTSGTTGGYQLLAIYSTDVTDNTLGVEDRGADIPSSFNLSNNYPNPFNPSTTIKYSIPVESSVSIVIYSILGQEIQTLVNDEHSPGVYKAVWNGQNYFGQQTTSGVYLCRIIARPLRSGEAFTQIRKLL